MSLSELGVYSLGEEKWEFLRSGSPDQFETPVWGWMSCVLEVAVSLYACDSCQGAWVSAWHLCIAVTCLWLDKQHPPLPDGVQQQRFASCL